MIFLKGFTLILLNIALAYLLLTLVKAFIFFPKKEIYYRNKKIPFTPGLIYRKKEWLITKLSNILHDYLSECEDIDSKTNRVYNWEQNAFNKAWEKLNFVDSWSYIPSFARRHFKHFSALIIYEIVKQFLRDFVPYLINKYNVESYIEILNQKLNIELIETYFFNYIYKWVLYVVLACSLIIGFINMIFMFIIY